MLVFTLPGDVDNERDGDPQNEDDASDDDDENTSSKSSSEL